MIFKFFQILLHTLPFDLIPVVFRSGSKILFQAVLNTLVVFAPNSVVLAIIPVR